MLRTLFYFVDWPESFALRKVTHSYINWIRFDFHATSYYFQSRTLANNYFFFVLQIQCILQDVGSNIATPRSSARDSHISTCWLLHIKTMSRFSFMSFHYT